MTINLFFIFVVPCDILTTDIGFIIDSSYSIRKHYQKEKDFVKGVAASVGLANKNNVRASVITFSTWARLSIKFKDHADSESFNKSVDAIPFMGYQTRIDKALRLAQTQMLKKENGARTGIKKLVLLMADGAQSGDSERPETVAKEIRDAGVEIIAVGIGNRVDFDELVRITGDRKRVFTSSFDDIASASFVGKITGATSDIIRSFMTHCPGM